jgi:hypothetical protein
MIRPLIIRRFQKGKIQRTYLSLDRRNSRQHSREAKKIATTTTTTTTTTLILLNVLFLLEFRSLFLFFLSCSSYSHVKLFHDENNQPANFLVLLFLFFVLFVFRCFSCFVLHAQSLFSLCVCLCFPFVFLSVLRVLCARIGTIIKSQSLFDKQKTTIICACSILISYCRQR